MRVQLVQIQGFSFSTLTSLQILKIQPRSCGVFVSTVVLCPFYLMPTRLILTLEVTSFLAMVLRLYSFMRVNTVSCCANLDCDVGYEWLHQCAIIGATSQNCESGSKTHQQSCQTRTNQSLHRRRSRLNRLLVFLLSKNAAYSIQQTLATEATFSRPTCYKRDPFTEGKHIVKNPQALL